MALVIRFLGQVPLFTIDASLAPAPQEEQWRAIEEQGGERSSESTLIALEDLDGQWVALYNHRTGLLGPQGPVLLIGVSRLRSLQSEVIHSPSLYSIKRVTLHPP